MSDKYKYKTEPFEHQRQALLKGAEKNNFAYFMEMGTGKTKVAIDNACYLYQQNKIEHVVVIAPNSVYRNWKREISIHAPVECVVNYHKQKGKPNKGNGLNWFLINVEAFSRDSGKKAIAPFIGKATMMILDESTTIKNRQAIRTKTLCKLGKLVKYKRILTGSPITKSPLDLYTQCEFLSPALLGFTNYFTFRARYAVMHQMEANGRTMLFPKYYTNLDELEMKLKGFSYRVRKQDCLDLPPKTYTSRAVQITGEQLKTYQELKRAAWTIIKSEEVSFKNKLTEILRLHQVANGFVNTNDGNIVDFKNCPKMAELMSILEETDGKVIIWANYVHNIKKIITKLTDVYGQDSVVAIYGEVTNDKRSEAVRRFQEDKRCRFFVGNPSTGGYGLTLTEAEYVIYFSNSYNLEVRQQSEDRAHRIGQTKNVQYIDLIAEDTIDEFVITALAKKLTISAETLGEQVSVWLK